MFLPIKLRYPVCSRTVCALRSRGVPLTSFSIYIIQCCLCRCVEAVAACATAAWSVRKGIVVTTRSTAGGWGVFMGTMAIYLLRDALVSA